MKHEEISLYTKRTLSKALNRAMLRKPFEKITVSELIQEVQFNRKTFYYHFADIYDLLKWTLEEDALRVLRSFDLRTDFEGAVRFVMRYVEENDHMLNCVLDSLGRDGLKRLFLDEFRNIVDSLLQVAEEESGRTIEPGYRSFLVHFYEDALAGLLVEWVQDRGRGDTEVMANYLSRTVRESLRGILVLSGSSEQSGN